MDNENCYRSTEKSNSRHSGDISIWITLSSIQFIIQHSNHNLLWDVGATPNDGKYEQEQSDQGSVFYCHTIKLHDWEISHDSLQSRRLSSVFLQHQSIRGRRRIPKDDQEEPLTECHLCLQRAHLSLLSSGVSTQTQWWHTHKPAQQTSTTLERIYYDLYGGEERKPQDAWTSRYKGTGIDTDLRQHYKTTGRGERKSTMISRQQLTGVLKRRCGKTSCDERSSLLNLKVHIYTLLN